MQRGPVISVLVRETPVSFLAWLMGRRSRQPEIRQVHCGQHGTSTPAFVCRHAAAGTDLGFYVANSPHPDNSPGSDFDGCPNGWCEECEKVRLKCGGWNDESEAFCAGRMVCIGCFEEIRRRNTTGRETP